MNKWIEKYRARLRKEDRIYAEAMSRLTPKGVVRTVDGLVGFGLSAGVFAGIVIALLFLRPETVMYGYFLVGLIVITFFGAIWETMRFTKIRNAVRKAEKVDSP